LHWTQADRATAYNVKRSATSGGPYSTVSTVSVPPTGWDNGTTYTDVNLTNGTAYYYVVTSSSQAGESAPSLELTATTSKADSSKLTGTPIGTATLKLLRVGRGLIWEVPT
jgi:hypothetical protein